MNKAAPFPHQDQVWEAIADCEVQIQYLFTAPITFSGVGRLAIGERVIVTTGAADPPPVFVSFLPVRYKELHDSLVPADIRETPRYKEYSLSVRTEYFREHFRLIEDANST